MTGDWQRRFAGVRPVGTAEPSLAVAPAVSAPPTASAAPTIPAAPCEPAPDAPSVAIRLVGGRDDRYCDGEAVAVHIEATGLPAHPPLAVDVVAVCRDGGASGGAVAGKTVLRRNGDGRRPATATVSLLAITDENVAAKSGAWHGWVIVGGDRIAGTIDFHVAPSSSWLLRSVRVGELACRPAGSRGRRRQGALRGLGPTTRLVDLTAKLSCPRGTAGLRGEVRLELVAPSGQTVAEDVADLGDGATVELGCENVALAPPGGAVAEGEWLLVLSLDGVELDRQRLTCRRQDWFTNEGELSREGRNLVIGGVPVERD